MLQNGIDWKSGDEILLLQGDFPATIYPSLGLQAYGIRVRILKPHGLSPTADEVTHEISASTRLLCISWVNSFTGDVLDLELIGRISREHNTIFVLNGLQGVGVLQIDLREVPIDVMVSCGYKWLCGPYGAGFCWIRPELRARLRQAQTYWLPQVGGEANLTMTSYPMKKIGSAAFDVFCTANVFNFLPWRASIERAVVVAQRQQLVKDVRWEAFAVSEVVSK